MNIMHPYIIALEYIDNFMRQHVNPLSSNFNQIEKIPPLSEMFSDLESLNSSLKEGILSI